MGTSSLTFEVRQNILAWSFRPRRELLNLHQISLCAAVWSLLSSEEKSVACRIASRVENTEIVKGHSSCNQKNFKNGLPGIASLDLYKCNKPISCTLRQWLLSCGRYFWKCDFSMAKPMKDKN